MAKATFSRLPTSVVPSNYKIHLFPDLVNFKFKGECEVTASVVEETDVIVCNALNLDIESASVITNGEEIQGNIACNEEEEKLTLKIDKALGVGSTVVVKYKYTGTHNDKMRGFYRARYTKDGEERYSAVTMFESTDARQAFPCWDEPAIKATFDVTVTGPTDRQILSNTPEIEVVEEGESKTVKFDTSPIMSTYLVAIVVGEFDYVEDFTRDGIQVRVYSPVGKKEQGRFALECGVKSLEFYKDFFDVAYPLKKYDMIAIPDFSAGAMENWGLVTYRETCILVDPKTTSASTKEFVAIVTCHEAAHQWFGDLVTMEWWTHLWLNEGFASFMENLTTDHLYPEYKIWEQFVPGTLIKALELDALSSSHAIEVPVGHPSEVDEIFDNISYNKGASVIRMLYNWIGDSCFKAGMHNYLIKYSYKNAETPQLWAELEAASGMPVTRVMKSWTEQMGFPVISVKSRQEGSDKILTLTQTKFCSGLESDGNGYLWNIPISIACRDGRDVIKVMLDKQSMEVKISNIEEGDWIKLNPGFVEFYRVNYTSEDLEKLCQAVQSHQLSPVDRLNILDDVFSLISAGKMETVLGLRLLQAYKAEDSYIVWNSINNAIVNLSILLADQPYYCNFERFVLDIFSEIKQKVTWDARDDEEHFDTLLRSLVLSRIGKCGDEEIRAEAKRRFEQHVSGAVPIRPDLRSTVYSCTACLGDSADFESMLRLYRSADQDEEKDRLGRAGLTSFQSIDTLQKVLLFSISEDVRAQDSVFIIGGVARNKNGRDLAWQFFKENFVMLKERYSSGFLLAHLVKSVTERFLTGEMACVIENYFEENALPGAVRNVQQAVETIRLNVAWLARDGEAIKNFFSKI